MPASHAAPAKSASPRHISLIISGLARASAVPGFRDGEHVTLLTATLRDGVTADPRRNR